MAAGIIELDVHGYYGGTRIADGIREEFGYGREPKVKRITMGQESSDLHNCIL